MKITVEHWDSQENEVILRCRDWEGSALPRRTTLWALVCNLGFLGCSVAFGWFRSLPLWGGHC